MTSQVQAPIEKDISSPACDFLLVIALEEEFRHLLSVLKIKYESEDVDGLHCYRFRLAAPRSGYAEGIATFIGEMGISEANSITFRLVSSLGAGLVVNIGIAGIIDADVRIGDVVVATDSDNYLYRSKIKQKVLNNTLNFDDLSLGGRSLPTTESFCRLVKNLPFTDPEISEAWLSASYNQLTQGLEDAVVDHLRTLRLISDASRVHVGQMACGPWVGAAEKFKQEVLAKRNRNYLAMDMESYGILQAAHENPVHPQTLVLRGISDPADERKSQLDQIEAGFLREWSMSNALRLFARVIEKVEVQSYTRRDPAMLEVPPESMEDLGNTVREIVVREYLSPPYNDLTYVKSRSFERYSELFSISAVFDLLEDNRSLLTSLVDVTLSSNRTIPLLIEGPAGTGKTSLLSILYWLLLEDADDRKLLPVFVNLHRYNELSARVSKLGPGDQAMAALEQHLDCLARFIQRYPDYPVLLIVDGYDDFARFKEPALAYMSNLLKNARHWKIIGSRDGTMAFQDQAAEDEPPFSATLQSVGTKDPKFDSYLKAFVAIASPEGNALEESMKQLIADCKLKEVDFFILSLALEHSRIHRTSDRHSLSKLLENYCQKYLRHRSNRPLDQERPLERAAAIAFAYAMQKERSVQQNELVLWELGQQHPTISDYLSAQHMITEFMRAAEGKAKVLRKLPPYVYPHRINHLAKELLNQAPSQHTFVKAVEKILKSTKVHPYVKAQACYLAGRLEDQQAKERARKILNEFRADVQKRQLIDDNRLGKAELLLVRTLYISLAYIGEENAQEEYIEALLADRNMDMFNRGFHLEYYEDQKYTPSEPLTSSDRLDPCPRTFNQLIANLSGGGSNPISEIELFTLCSLAQHRHAVAKLSTNDRLRIMELIRGLLNEHRIKSGVLRTYVAMVMKHIKHENFHISRIFSDYYKIKSTKRSGWLARGIRDGESVADHSYGAYLLALFLLPDEWPKDTSYSKQKIMNMLLIHDLAEAITGDILPDDSNEDSKRKEREVYEELALLGTYEGLASMREVGSLWEEFEGQATLNARVAKDIDKLENLVQLWIYLKEGKQIRDFDKWREGLLDSIKTQPGDLALKKLLASYEPKL